MPSRYGNAVLSSSATRLSIDLRKNAGVVYSVNSNIQSGRTRSVFLVHYASNSQNVAKAADAVAREVSDMEIRAGPRHRASRAKALLLRQIPLNKSSVEDMARDFLDNEDLGLTLNEDEIAAEHYATLDAGDVQAVFRKWMRPTEMVRASQDDCCHETGAERCRPRFYLPIWCVCAFNLPLARIPIMPDVSCPALVKLFASATEQRSSLLGRKEDHEDISFVGHTLRGGLAGSP